MLFHLVNPVAMSGALFSLPMAVSASHTARLAVFPTHGCLSLSIVTSAIFDSAQVIAAFVLPFVCLRSRTQSLYLCLISLVYLMLLPLLVSKASSAQPLKGDTGLSAGTAALWLLRADYCTFHSLNPHVQQRGESPFLQ